MANTTTNITGVGGKDRVLAMAQQIVKSLDTLKVILRWDSNSVASRRSLPWDDSPKEVVEYLSVVDEVLNLIDGFSIRSSNEFVDRAETVIQLAMSRLEDEFLHILIRNTVPLDAEGLYELIHRVSLSFASNDGDLVRSLSLRILSKNRDIPLPRDIRKVVITTELHK